MNNEFWQVLVNVGIFLGIIWGAAKGALSIYKQVNEVASLPADIEAQQEETARQLAAMWRKLDGLEALTDARLDRLDRLVSWIGGSVGVNVEKMGGDHD